ncbi:MAG: hypothetical protein PHP57_13820 [Sideroxydans sp.]|nr:hypothetical protein [Sideroxydans sp.]
MNEELEEARKAQHNARALGCSLESDYALLEATQRAIDAQTVECEDCDGRNTSSLTYLKQCPVCNGRGRVPK